jgi:translocation and assembly module TamB
VSRKKKILLSSAGLVIFLPLVLLMVFYLMLSTESGTRWLVDQGIDLAADEKIFIKAQSIHGALLGRLEIRQLEIRIARESANDGQNNNIKDDVITLDQFLFQWQPLKLFGRLALIEQIKLNNLLLKLNTAEDAESSSETLVIPDVVLPIAVELQKLEINNIYLDSLDSPAIVDRLQLGLLLNKNGLVIKDFNLTNAQASAAGNISADMMQPHAIDGLFTIDAVIPDQGNIASEVKLSGEILKPVIDLALKTPVKASITGNADLHQAQPFFDMHANWSAFQWPLQGKSELTIKGGKLSAVGMINDYQLNLNTVLQTPQLPLSEIKLDANGSTEKLMLNKLLLNTLDGRIAVNGDINIAPELSWNLQLEAENLNPGLIDKQLQGKLGGHLLVTGQLNAQGIITKVAIDDISGQLREYPLNLTGDVNYQNEVLSTRRIVLRLGDNQVNVSGTIADAMAIDLSIQAPRLDQFYVDLAGSIKGHASLGGNMELPEIDLAIDAAQVAFQENRLEKLTLSGQWQKQQGSIKLQAENIKIENESVDRLELALDGQLEKHQLLVKLKAPEKSLGLQLDGELKPDFSLWSGQVSQLDAMLQTFQWQLETPADLELSQKYYQIRKFCLTGQKETICLDGKWQVAQQQINADVSLSNFHFSQLQPILPEGLAINGSVSGEVHAQGKLDNLKARAVLKPTDGIVSFKDDTEEFKIPYKDMAFAAQFSDDNGEVNFNFALGENGKGNGFVKIGKAPARLLNGRLNASIPDLRIVQGFIPDLQAVQGTLALDMNLAGKLEKPLIKGKLTLLNGSANIPAAGLELTKMNVALEADDLDQMKIQASVHSGQGQLKATGAINVASFPAKISLALKGDRFQIARLPEAIVEITPDLLLEGRESFRLIGELRIPTAKIEIQELPESAVKVSSDEIIVGEAVESRKARNISADLNIILGEQVSFKGFGLQTGLTGDVNAVYDGEVSRLYGRIEMRDGKYKSFGQNLQVETGRFIFAGPTDNPGIDLKAKRVSRDKSVTAYLAVSGQVSKPITRVYSVPALSETEALSYLVTGQSMNKASGEDSNELSSAALALGLSQTMPALKTIKEDIGIDDLRIEDDVGGIEGSSLLVGKYLNPDLYVGYVQGLFEPQGGVKVNYRLSKKIEVESFSGEEKDSVHIYFRHEHD